MGEMWRSEMEALVLTLKSQMLKANASLRARSIRRSCTAICLMVDEIKVERGERSGRTWRSQRKINGRRVMATQGRS